MHPFEKKRISRIPKIPLLLKNLSRVSFCSLEKRDVLPEVECLFPLLKESFVQTLSKQEVQDRKLRIGVLFSGGPAPGGHNVIAGLISSFPDLTLIGFLGGALGLLEEKYEVLDQKIIFSQYLNTGGFDLLGSGRTKIETQEQLEKACQVVVTLNLDGLVIIGGDDSNTNAAVLSQRFLEKKIKTIVVGVPKTIDGDQRHTLNFKFNFENELQLYEGVGLVANNVARLRTELVGCEHRRPLANKLH